MQSQDDLKSLAKDNLTLRRQLQQYSARLSRLLNGQRVAPVAVVQPRVAQPEQLRELRCLEGEVRRARESAAELRGHSEANRHDGEDGLQLKIRQQQLTIQGLQREIGLARRIVAQQAQEIEKRVRPVRDAEQECDVLLEDAGRQIVQRRREGMALWTQAKQQIQSITQIHKKAFEQQYQPQDKSEESVPEQVQTLLAEYRALGKEHQQRLADLRLRREELARVQLEVQGEAAQHERLLAKLAACRKVGDYREQTKEVLRKIQKNKVLIREQHQKKYAKAVRQKAVKEEVPMPTLIPKDNPEPELRLIRVGASSVQPPPAPAEASPVSVVLVGLADGIIAQVSSEGGTDPSLEIFRMELGGRLVRLRGQFLEGALTYLECVSDRQTQTSFGVQQAEAVTFQFPFRQHELGVGLYSRSKEGRVVELGCYAARSDFTV